MRQLIVLFGIIFFMACNTKSNRTPVDSGKMPVGAIVEAFDDSPNMVKVTTNDEKGQISAYGTYVDSLREGSWVEYHPNGQVKTVIGYVHGLKEGKSVELDDRGQLLEQFTYHNGELNGPYTKYNRTRIKEERNYKNGLLDGETKIYYDNGKVMEESLYKEGKRDGIARWYDEEGNMTIEYTYKDGEWIKDAK